MLNRKRKMKLLGYGVVGLLLVVMMLIAGLYYYLEQSLDTMYEPLPSMEWQLPHSSIEEEATHQDSLTLSMANHKEISKDENEKLGTGDPSSPGETSDPISAGHEFTTINQEQLNQLRHPDLNQNSPFSILLLGVDQRPGDQGRSDTLILLSINQAKEKTIAISIPRDTRLLIPQTERYDKINHAYAFGGTTQAVAAVERLLGVPIAYYMKTNMDGLTKIIDTLDGISLVNEREFTLDSYQFPKGKLHLNGEEALAYVRMRKSDPAGDFGRMNRQRQVLTAAVNQISFSSINKLPSLLAQLAKHVRTNLTFTDMMSLAMGYKSSIKQVDTLYMQGKSSTLNGIYYWLPDLNDRIRIQKLLLELLLED